jgi:hypothetical protein
MFELCLSKLLLKELILFAKISRKLKSRRMRWAGLGDKWKARKKDTTRKT